MNFRDNRSICVCVCVCSNEITQIHLHKTVFISGIEQEKKAKEN